VTDMRDELLEQIVDELRTLPPVDEPAVGRIVRAAAADVIADRGSRGYPPTAGGMARAVPWWQSRVPLVAAAGLALAAGLGGYAMRGGGSSTVTVVASEPAPESLTFASANRGALSADRAVPTQFVLDAPRASHVALVGDFNGWNADAAPLTRDSSSGIWTVTVGLRPGRHVYAFMVDGKTWTLDPRAPAAQDPEFGTPSSVVLVGTP
jgi:hypothetical protein